MSSGDPFGLVVALALFLACAAVGAGLLRLFDLMTGNLRHRLELDRCQDCGTVLQFRMGTTVYRPHVCRPRY